MKLQRGLSTERTAAAWPPTIVSMPSDPDSAATWTSLLAQALHLAQASAAFAKTADGDRFRAAVPAIISLQAITLALQGIDKLDHAERGLGIDRARLLLAKHAAELHTLWRGEQFPATITELMADAHAAIATAAGRGVLLIVTGQSSCLVQSLLLAQPARVGQIMLDFGFAGTLWLAGPGVAIGPDSPIAFVRGPRGGAPETAVLDKLADSIAIEAGFTQSFTVKPGLQRLLVPRAVQVYRTIEPLSGHAQAAASVVVDTFAWFDDALPAGRPLLVPVLEAGGMLPLPNSILFAGLSQPAGRVGANPAGVGHVS